MDQNERAEKFAQDEISKIPPGDRIKDRTPAPKEAEEVQETDGTENDDFKFVPPVEDEESDDEDEEDDESHEDDEDDDNPSKIPKSFLDKEKAKRLKLKEENKRLRQIVADSIGKKVDDVSEDDFSELTDELAKELGIDDKDNAAKLLKVMAKLNKRQSDPVIKALQSKIDQLESKENEKTLIETYKSEWNDFQKDLGKEFPDLSKEDSRKVSELMYTLSHTPGIGGVEYVDIDGKRKLNPYDLSYIFYKNRDKFEEVVSGKKVKGMEVSRTRGATYKEPNKSGDSKPLTKDAPVSDIMKRDQEMRLTESRRNSLREGGNNRI